MGVMVDSNILLDLLTIDPVWLAWSEEQFRREVARGPLVVNPIICAEIAPVFDHDWQELDEWLIPASFKREALPFAGSTLASAAFEKYKARGGVKTSPLPDFYIGAHAQAEGHTRITRDVNRYRAYFPAVPLICP